MNTKSFVNQFDADNVVKGYYDESDQLVMVEPEGSGCKLRTVTMTVGSGINVPVSIPKIAESPDGTNLIVCLIDNIREGIYKLAATESGGAFEFNYEDVVISGNAERDDHSVIVYTGDFNISAAEGE